MIDHVPSKTPFFRPGPEPSKAPANYEGGADQANRRMLVTYRDHHKDRKFQDGRPWWGYVELPADPKHPMGAVGAMQPGNHEFPFGTREDPTHERWEAPWYPQEKFFDFDHRRGTIRLRYDKMIAEYTSENRVYYAAANKIAAGNGWEPPKMGGALHPRFIDILGQQPQSVKIPQAAQAGDRWLLGFTDEPNEELAKILKETTYGDWAGMTYEDALAVAGGTKSAPLSNPEEVLSLNAAQLNDLIAAAVANAIAQQSTKKNGSGAGLEKARAAKAAKKAQAEAVAST